jgi:hypothetical protein
MQGYHKWALAHGSSCFYLIDFWSFSYKSTDCYFCYIHCHCRNATLQKCVKGKQLCRMVWGKVYVHNTYLFILLLWVSFYLLSDAFYHD